MNPLLKVDPKVVNTINNQKDIAAHRLSNLEEKISSYLSICLEDASNLTSKPKMQHLVPKFLLRDFEGNVDGLNKLKVLSYKVPPNGNVTVQEIADMTSSGFTKQEDFYSINFPSIDEFSQEYDVDLDYGPKDKYIVEKIISIIENNASPMLKLRQNEDFYNSTTYDNPYWYPDVLLAEEHKYTSSAILDNTTGRRIALAVFFAVQYLRSYFIYKSLKKKHVLAQLEDGSFVDLTEKDFPYFIWLNLPSLAALFYNRAWRWVYSSWDGLMPGGSAVLPIYLNPVQEDLGQEHSFIMPLGRNSTIYFLEKDTFSDGHDGVFYSNCLGVSNWSISKIRLALAFDLSATPNKANMREARICTHPDTNLAHLFRTGQEPDPALVDMMTKVPTDEEFALKSLSFLGAIPRR